MKQWWDWKVIHGLVCCEWMKIRGNWEVFSVPSSEIDRRLQVEALSTLLATNISLANALSKWRVMFMSHEKNKHDFTPSMIRFDRCLFFGWDLWFSHIPFHKVCTQTFMASSYLMVDRKKIALWRQFQLDIPSIYSFHFQGICLDSSSLILRVPSRMGFSPVMWVVPFIFVWNQGVWGGEICFMKQPLP